MSEQGYVKISRKAYAPQEAGGDPFWNEPRVFSRWEAWEYMIQSAAYADHKRIVSGDVVEIPRGHTPPLALSYLAEAWGWSTKRVRNFIKLLDEMDRIRAVGGARSGTVYLVVNYDYYQSQGQAKGQAKGNGGGTLGARSGQELEEGKASKEGKEKTDSAKRGHQIPDAWKPSESHREMADRLGVGCEDEAEKFRDHWLSKGEPRKDWDATFRNWLRNARQFTRPGKTPADQQQYKLKPYQGLNA